MIPLECEIGIGKFINKENGLKIVIIWEKRFKGAVVFWDDGSVIEADSSILAQHYDSNKETLVT